MDAPAPQLVIGIGNPSRGDDALGPLLVERLQALELPGVELLSDFQLQVEYVLDLAERTQIIFVDAAASGPEPYRFAPIAAVQDRSHTTHALSPAALLAAYAKHHGEPAPPAWVLAIRGYGFALGEGLSGRAADNLEAALQLLVTRLRTMPWDGGV